MDDSTLQLEELFIQNLQAIINLKNESEKQELDKQDQLKDIALGIIDVLDSFERLEESLIERGIDKNKEANTAMNRYKNLQKKLLNLLNKYQIAKMEFPENRLIIGWCEVVDVEPNSYRKNDEIISIVRSGYVRFQKEVIRAAQIIVVKN